MIVQAYKSQVMVGGNLFPIPLGGSTLNWPKNDVVPMVAGNYWQINYVEGLQTPSADAQIALLDGDAAKCPLGGTFLNDVFMTRTADYRHDVAAITSGIKYFDGYSGFVFPDVKAASFTIGGSKGDDVRFSMSMMIYSSDGAIPSPTTSPPDGAYPYFSGQPIRFQACSFKRNGAFSGMDGLMSWNISFTNNMTPDLSMKGQQNASWPYQTPLPIDCNAGVQAASAQFTFQANSTQHISTGDNFDVLISQNGINRNFHLTSGTIETPNDRGVGIGRQTRTYNCIVRGSDNSNPPLIIT